MTSAWSHGLSLVTWPQLGRTCNLTAPQLGHTCESPHLSLVTWPQLGRTCNLTAPQLGRLRGGRTSAWAHHQSAEPASQGSHMSPEKKNTYRGLKGRGGRTSAWSHHQPEELPSQVSHISPKRQRRPNCSLVTHKMSRAHLGLVTPPAGGAAVAGFAHLAAAVGAAAVWLPHGVLVAVAWQCAGVLWPTMEGIDLHSAIGSTSALSRPCGAVCKL